ncbi:RnfH family protein [Thalassotalea piscium]
MVNMSTLTTESNSDKAEQIQVEVVYGLPHKQEILTISVNPGTTIEQAIEASDIQSIFNEIDLSVHNVGIWNRSAKLTDVVTEGDRIEIYRPLIADPKEVRKRRAEKAKLEGRADKVTGGRVDPRRGQSE